MENVNGINNDWATMHCGSAPGGPCSEFTGLGGQRACAGTRCQAGFHTYGLEWDRGVTPEVIRFYLDGVQFHQVSAANMDPAAWASATNHGFFIILNLAMGGAFPAAFGGGPTAATVPGHPMVVDYVAAWQAGGTGGGGGGGGGTPPPPGDYTQSVTAGPATPAKLSLNNPPGGSYPGTQSVAISTSTAGATIHYTTDGSTPTASSPVYTGPLTVAKTTTVKAIGTASGMTTSAVATAAYTISAGGNPDYTQ